MRLASSGVRVNENVVVPPEDVVPVVVVVVFVVVVLPEGVVGDPEPPQPRQRRAAIAGTKQARVSNIARS
jgi:hypothetical protein